MTNDLCSAFRKNPDGSWTSVRSVAINSPTGNIQIGTGVTFTRGVLWSGIDLAAYLDQNCLGTGY